LDLLIKKAEENKTQIKFNQEIIDIQKEENVFVIKTVAEEFRSHKLIIATGGISYPKSGTTGY
jgi:predicted flavoprotein YhiN